MSQDAYIYLKKGEILFKEGSASTDLYWLLKGRVAIYKNASDKVAVRLDTLKQGDILGELSFITGDERSYTVVAIEDCQLANLKREDFLEDYESLPTWTKNLIHGIATRLSNLSEHIKKGGKQTIELRSRLGLSTGKDDTQKSNVIDLFKKAA